MDGDEKKDGDIPEIQIGIRKKPRCDDFIKTDKLIEVQSQLINNTQAPIRYFKMLDDSLIANIQRNIDVGSNTPKITKSKSKSKRKKLKYRYNMTSYDPPSSFRAQGNVTLIYLLK